MPKLTPVHYQTLVKAFKKAGFVIVRRESSHIILEKKGFPQIPRLAELDPANVLKMGTVEQPLT